MRALAVIATLVVGCADGDVSGDDTDTVQPAPTWPAPTVTVDAPASGAALTGRVRVQVRLTDFRLSGVADTLGWWPSPLALIEGQAWAHVITDEPNGYISYRVDGVTLADTIETDVELDLSAFEPGQHALLVELFYPDGDGFYPPVLAQVPFTWTPEAAPGGDP